METKPRAVVVEVIPHVLSEGADSVGSRVCLRLYITESLYLLGVLCISVIQKVLCIVVCLHPITLCLEQRKLRALSDQSAAAEPCIEHLCRLFTISIRHAARSVDLFACLVNATVIVVLRMVQGKRIADHVAEFFPVHC